MTGTIGLILACLAIAETIIVVGLGIYRGWREYLYPAWRRATDGRVRVAQRLEPRRG